MKNKFIVVTIIISLLLTGCADSNNEKSKINVPYSALIKDNNTSSETNSSAESEPTEDSSANFAEDGNRGNNDNKSIANDYNSSVGNNEDVNSIDYDALTDAIADKVAARIAEKIVQEQTKS